MKERPIIFSASMVRAILEGRKTQTRRVVKGIDSDGCFTTVTDVGFPRVPHTASTITQQFKCPFGVPGDRLWVRESIRLNLDKGWCYEADGQALQYGKDDEDTAIAWVEIRPAKQRYCPSIHMPRWASRIKPEVTGVRVERLQAISEEDARAEGLFHNQHGYEGSRGFFSDNPRTAFADIWDSIYSNHREIAMGEAKCAWYINPWVWVVEFRKVES
jgi:hypothetical protein